MLVLFTLPRASAAVVHELHDPLQRCGITLLAQGVEGSRRHILQRFQDEVRSVLFGTDSFLGGSGCPGRNLWRSCHVRLPFAVPTEPIIQAQMEEIEKNPAKILSWSFPSRKPQSSFRQGAGRLIRRSDDRGAVIILDNRVSQPGTARFSNAPFRGEPFAGKACPCSFRFETVVRRMKR